MYVENIYSTSLDSMFNDLYQVRKRAATDIVAVLTNCYHAHLTDGYSCELTLDTDEPIYPTYGNDPSDVKRYPIKAMRVVPDKADADKDGYIAIHKMWQDIEVFVEFNDGTTEWNNDIYDTTSDEMVYLLRAVINTLKKRVSKY